MAHQKVEESLCKERQNGDVKESINQILKAGRKLANPPPGEEVVITGMAGRFPKSDDLCQFRDNLLNKVDMVTPGNRNWHTDHSEIPKRSGKINYMEKFDAGFFGVHQRQANMMDPLGRQLLERTYEAVMDSGFDPQQLRGTRTGVFVGVFIREAEKPWFYSKLESPNYRVTGCITSILAQQVSYFMGLNGPAYTIDSACSTSLYVLEHAYRAIRSGKCNSALVAGVNSCLNPLVTLGYARLGVLSLDGSCKCFDEDANGYVRSEAVSVIYLQKSKHAKRIYAQIVHAKTNCDGFKEQGVTYPSWFDQSQLFREVCEESNVDPTSVDYVEGHITGTKVGDPAEIRSIEEVYCFNRTKPLLVGSIKSNIGHTEGCAGLCSVIKVLLSMNSNYLLPNINYKRPPPGIIALESGKMVVITDPLPWPEDGSGIAAVNNFGFGGANANVLLKKIAKQVNNGQPKDDVPRLVCVSGRTEKALTCILDDLSRRTLDEKYIKLFHEVFRNGITGHPYRGYVIASKTGELRRSLRRFDCNTRNLCLVIGSSNKCWLSIGRQLTIIPFFKYSLQRMQQILLSKGIDLSKILNQKRLSQNTENIIIGSISVQIALVDLLKHIELPIDYVMGYSTGELISAYADDALTLEQVTLCAYYIGHCANNEVKLERHELEVIHCNSLVIDHKSNNSTRLGLNGNDLKLLQCLKKVIPRPKQRSSKWITRSPKNGQLPCNSSKYASAEYFIDNLRYPVLLSETLSAIPGHSVMLEIGYKLTNPQKYTSVKLEEKEMCRSQNITPLLCTLGKLYELGYSLKLDNLYPIVQWPVGANTPMISPLIKWNHSEDWFVPSYQMQDRIKIGHRTITFDVKESAWAYMTGHNIDGHNLIPATGYLVMVWETLSIIEGQPMQQMKIAFENIKFHRATAISSNGTVKLTISVQKTSGMFEVEELSQTVVSGRIYVPENDQSEMVNFLIPEEEGDRILLTSRDIYKELRLRGYYYTGSFCGLKESNLTASRGKIEWTSNWTTFIDNMLQIKILQEDTRTLYVPISIKRLTIDATMHVQYIHSLGENPLVPVYSYREANIIKSGAIQIRGFATNSFPRRKLQGQPVLEAYKFIPLEAELTTKQSIRVVTQILLENTYGTNLRVVEIMDETVAAQKPLGPLFHESIEEQPSIQSQIVLLTKKALKLDNITVKNGKLGEHINECSLVIASSILNKAEIIAEAVQAVKENGMILSREDVNIGTSISNDNRFGLDILSVHKTQTERLVLLRKTKKLTAATVIDITNTIKNFNWLQRLQLAIRNDERVLIVAQDEPLNGIIGFFNCLKQEPGGFHVKCVFVLDKAPKFDLSQKFYSEQLRKGLNVNIFKDGKWGTYRHLLLEHMDTVEREHVFNNVTVRGDLASLRWIEGSLSSKSILGPEKTLVYVYYCALNFRDIMTASGRISNDVITKDRLEQHNVQGFEYCGREASGKRIMGMANTGALASIVVADSYCMWEIPNQWSMEEAVTVPVIYSTVLYSFLRVAQLKSGQSILIHSGSGGIGQAAINVALYFKCVIFTTVGTEEKKEFIKTNFPQIPESHIGNSRNTSFEQVIMTETDGRGVDIVLNSLADEKLQTSVRCLAPGGKFLEIGKFDITRDSTLGLNSLTEGRSFHGITFDAFFSENPSIKATLHKLVLDGINMGYIKPISRTIFKKSEVEQAFRYMTTGKHIGKVIINLRREEVESNIKPRIRLFKGTPRFSSNSENCYIIIGGLGGFGLELADWLITRGVRKLILASRNGVRSGYQASRIRIWKSYGAIVKILTFDVTREEGCSAIIKEANKLGPVEGIFNLAVVLQDNVLENQCEDSFVRSLAPKAIATQNLDIISREMCHKLKYFVVFSSVSCGRGIAGQTNYGLANSVMERICEQRRMNGYPALAIQWGAIGEVGLLAEMQEQKEIGGTRPQSITSCLSVLDTLLRQTDEPVVSSMIIANKKGDKEMAENIVITIQTILGLKDLKTVSLHSPLSELGMDSMMAVEINQTLRRKYELFLTAKDIRRMTFKRLQEIAEENVANNKKENCGAIKATLQDLYQLQPTLGDKEAADVPIVRLNSLVLEDSAAPLMFLLPGITGIASIFEPLASTLNFHVFSLQFLDNERSDCSIESTAKALVPYIQEKLQGIEVVQFTLVAYSYGCIIALQIAALLEQNEHKGNIILIDGSPAVLKELLKRQELDTNSEPILQTNILCGLMELYVSNDILLAHKENIISCKTFEDRVYTVLSYIPKSTPHSKTHLKRLCIDTYARIKSILRYQPKFPRLKSIVKLWKPSQPLVEGFAHDYKIQELCEHSVEVKTFEGNHLTILKNPQLSCTINKMIGGNSSEQKQSICKSSDI